MSFLFLFVLLVEFVQHIDLFCQMAVDAADVVLIDNSGLLERVFLHE